MRVFARLPLIFVVALAVRMWFLHDYATHHPAHALGTIPFLFEPGNIAASLVAGNGFSSPFRVDTGPTAWMPPVYPLILAGIFKVFGLYTFRAFLAAAGLNVLFSALTCVPVYSAARRMFGTGVAAGAGWIWAVFPNAILLPYESLFEGSLSALLAALLLFSALEVSQSVRIRSWCLHGLLWGVALMTNASFISLLPFLFMWAGYRALRCPGFTAIRPAAAAGVALACCAPWAIRNFQVFQEFVPLRSVAGLALWLGNNDEGVSLTPDRLHPISNQAERDHYAEVGELAYMREKQELALAWIPSHPAQVLRLTSERFIALWTGGTPRPLADLQRSRGLRFPLVVGFNIALSVAALAGLIMLFRRRDEFLIPVAAFPVVYPMVFYLVLAHSRYRHPIDPVLAVLAAVACQALLAGPEPARDRAVGDRGVAPVPDHPI